jgi:hypothetical protein
VVRGRAARLPPHLPTGAVMAGGHGQIQIHAGGGAPFDPSDVQNAVRTAEIEAAAVAGVVVLDMVVWRRRRARRTRTVSTTVASEPGRESCP